MEIKYRYYSPKEDFGLLCKMILWLYTEDPEGEEVTVDKIRLTVNEAMLRPDKLSIFMLENEKEVIGYSILTFFWSNEHGGDIINIDEIFVAPEHRSKGFGTAFIDSLHEIYPMAKGLKLEASPSNLKAIKGYKNMGFTEAANIHMIKSL